jgi:hypothetical protein
MAERFLIQWDTASKAWPFRVVTTSGEGRGYFRTFLDAARYCDAPGRAAEG